MASRFFMAVSAAWCAAKRAFRDEYSGHVLADDPVQQEPNVQEVIVEGPSPPKLRNRSMYNALGALSPLRTPPPMRKFSRSRPEEFVDLASPFEKALHLLRKVMSNSLPPEVLAQLHQALKLLDESVGAGANRVDIAAELTRQTGKVKMEPEFEDWFLAQTLPTSTAVGIDGSRDRALRRSNEVHERSSPDSRKSKERGDGYSFVVRPSPTLAAPPMKRANSLPTPERLRNAAMANDQPGLAPRFLSEVRAADLGDVKSLSESLTPRRIRVQELHYTDEAMTDEATTDAATRALTSARSTKEDEALAADRKEPNGRRARSDELPSLSVLSKALADEYNEHLQEGSACSTVETAASRSNRTALLLQSASLLRLAAQGHEAEASEACGGTGPPPMDHVYRKNLAHVLARLEVDTEAPCGEEDYSGSSAALTEHFQVYAARCSAAMTSSVPAGLRCESDAMALADVPTLDWTLDVESLGDGCITALFLDVCRRHHVLEDLAADGLGLHLPTLHAYLGHLEDHYGNNPYHNKHHAADVTLGVHRFLAERWGAGDTATTTREAANAPPPLIVPTDVEAAAAGSSPSSTSGGLESSTKGFALTPLQIFAGLFAAAIHDFNHPGTSNSHEIGKDSKLAVLYHDESVLESHHLASAFSALLTPQHNFLSGWDRKAYVEFRQTVVQLVMMTDLSKHFDFVSKLNTLKTGSLQPIKAPDATLILTLAIKGADLGHPVKPWPLHLRWSRLMNEEFFLLGDRERGEGLPISTFCDRDKDTNLAKSQLGFLKFVCQPFFVAAMRVLVDEPAANAVSRLDANIKEWESYGEPQAASEDTPGSSYMPLST